MAGTLPAAAAATSWMTTDHRQILRFLNALKTRMSSKARPGWARFRGSGLPGSWRERASSTRRERCRSRRPACAPFSKRPGEQGQSTESSDTARRQDAARSVASSAAATQDQPCARRLDGSRSIDAPRPPGGGLCLSCTGVPQPRRPVRPPPPSSKLPDRVDPLAFARVDEPARRCHSRNRSTTAGPMRPTRALTTAVMPSAFVQTNHEPRVG